MGLQDCRYPGGLSAAVTCGRVHRPDLDLLDGSDKEESIDAN
jgi:hypothetical protein